MIGRRNQEKYASGKSDLDACSVFKLEMVIESRE